MTKIVKWWQRISFWNKLRGTFGSIGIGSEIALFAGDSLDMWKWIVGGATLISVLITFWIEDNDGDGTVDAFQDES